MSTVIFFIAAIGAITGAIGVIVLQNPFYCVLALVGHLISLAALFLLLRARVRRRGAGRRLRRRGDGALRVRGLLRRRTTPTRSARARAVAATLAARSPAAVALVAELFIAVLGSGLQAIDSAGAPYVARLRHA